MDRIPYREGEPPPDGGYVLADVRNDDGSSEGLFWVRAEDLRDSPLRHEEIEDIGPLLRWVWRHVGKHVKSCRSFEDWELGFLHDAHPEKEIALWVRGTYAYLQFIHENPANASRDGVFNAVFHLMNGREDLVKPKSAARRLRKLMGRGFPQKLFEIDNFTEDGHLKTGDKHLR